MTPDTLIGIAGVAVGVGALVPLYYTKGGAIWISTAIAGVFLFVSSGVLLYQRIAEGRTISRLQDDVLGYFSKDNPMTFEQIYDHLTNYPDYHLTQQAVSELVDDHRIRADRLSVNAPSGRVFSFRVYNNNNYEPSVTAFVASKTAPEANTPKPVNPASCPASLPIYNSPTVGGGHTQQEMCRPQLLTYQSQYPDCDIAWAATEDSHKELFGHVTYQYFCSYTAKPKA